MFQPGEPEPYDGNVQIFAAAPNGQPVDYGIIQNCMGFSLGIRDFAQVPRYGCPADSVNWFTHNIHRPDGPTKILFWPWWFGVSDFHWAFEGGNGRWYEKLGRTGVKSYPNRNALIQAVELRGGYDPHPVEGRCDRVSYVFATTRYSYISLEDPR